MKKIIILSSLFFLISCTSLRQQNEEVRTDLLKLTPLGTSETEVEKVINQNNWPVIKEGNESIVVELGIYSNIVINVAVYAHYDFDESKNLKEIAVEKLADGL